MRILLRGYYGHGNFGDDLLFKVIFHLVRSYFPGASITVLTDAAEPHYLGDVVNDSLEIVRSGHRHACDVVIYGGGGTFFDFERGTRLDALINAAARLLGYRTAASFLTLLRKATFRDWIRAPEHVGLGVGVGTYEKNSRRLRYDLPTLHRFNTLNVRDRGSLANARLLGVSSDLSVGSDLAFLYEHWLAADVCQVSSVKRSIGVIIRDWPSQWGRSLIDRLQESLSRQKYYRATYFVFDEQADSRLMPQFEGENVEIYRPGAQSITAMSKRLAEQELLISARAHGAIAGAVLGRPSLLVPLEPKLNAIRSMLPQSCSLIEDLSAAGLRREIGKMLSVPRAAIMEEVEDNRLKARSAVEMSLGLLRAH